MKLRLLFLLLGLAVMPLQAQVPAYKPPVPRTVAKSGSFSISQADAGTTFNVTAGGLARTVTLTGTFNDGFECWIRQVDGGAGSVSCNGVVISQNGQVMKVTSSGTTTYTLFGNDFAVKNLLQGAAQASFTTLGLVGSPVAWTAGATTMAEGAALTADGYARLPPANSFSSGTIISYTDSATTANFGRNFQPATGSDTLDGKNAAAWGATWLKPFIAGGALGGTGIYQFTTDGVSAWKSIYASARATKVQDPNDATKQAIFDASALPTATPGQSPIPKQVNIASGGNSTTVVASAATPAQFFNSINGTTGVLGSATVKWGNLASTVYVIDSTHIAAALPSPQPGTAIPTDDGTIDTVDLIAPLGAPLTVNWMHAGNYPADKRVKFTDLVGAIGSGTVVTLKAQNLENINDAPQITINEQNAMRELVSDGGVSWNISPGPGSGNGVQIAYQPLNDTDTPGTIRWNAVSGSGGQIGTVLLTGDDTLVIGNAQEGMVFRLTVVQDGAGNHKLKVAYPRKTSSGGAGYLNVAQGLNTISTVTGIYSNVTGELWTVDGTNFTSEPAPTPVCSGSPSQTVPPVGTGGYGTGTVVAKMAVSAGQKGMAGKFVANSTDVTMCKVAVPLIREGTWTPNGNLTAYLFADDGGAACSGGDATKCPSAPLGPNAIIPTGAASGASGTVAVSSLIDTGVPNTDIAAAYSAPSLFSWGSPFALTNGTTYWLVVITDATGLTTTNCIAWGEQANTYKAYVVNTSAVPWTFTQGGSNINLNFITYH